MLRGGGKKRVSKNKKREGENTNLWPPVLLVYGPGCLSENTGEVSEGSLGAHPRERSIIKKSKSYLKILLWLQPRDKTRKMRSARNLP